MVMLTLRNICNVLTVPAHCVLHRRRIAEKGSSPEPDQRSVSVIRSCSDFLHITHISIWFYSGPKYQHFPSLLNHIIAPLCDNTHTWYTTFTTFLSAMTHPSLSALSV